MCGILGIATTRDRRIGLSDAAVARMRDLMERRGPDGAGLWRSGHVALAHRRLSVIDPTPAGAQPFHSEIDPRTGRARFTLVYNGELYNDEELRRELGAVGVSFRSRCDTETLLAALINWGSAALARIRGIYAFALYDSELDLLTLARDPLGVKPLYWWSDGGQIVFASEPGPILAHPDVRTAPNLRMVSAYLTTIRTVLGEHTLYEGVSALRPGHALRCDLGGPTLTVRTDGFWRGPRGGALEMGVPDAAGALRGAMEDSVTRQLRADVPVCCLLSGGLDSTAITAVARARKADLLTFCAGAPVPGACSHDTNTEDLASARRAASALGTRHSEAHLSRESFLERWRWMVGAMRLPLSTPNETAIWSVATLLREAGCVVTLSGEGADELLAGYEGPMDAAADFVSAGGLAEEAGVFQLNACAWIPMDFKPSLLNPEVWRRIGEDQWLTAWFTHEFAAAAEECGDTGLDAHLRLHRRINLTGLLQRLDTATMLAGVEGRTPFADSEVATLCESLAMGLKYRRGGVEDAAGAGGVAVALRTGARTKMVLRSAFEGVVPEEALRRPKASFPLPFQQWAGEAVGQMRRSRFANEVFSPAAVEAVARNPERLWNLAWPMANIALWGDAMGW